MAKPKRKAVRKVVKDEESKDLLPQDIFRRDVKDIYHDVIELISVHERIVTKIGLIEEAQYLSMLDSGTRRYFDLLPSLSRALKKRADGVTEIQRRYIIAFRDLLVRGRSDENAQEEQVPAE